MCCGAWSARARRCLRRKRPSAGRRAAACWRNSSTTATRRDGAGTRCWVGSYAVAPRNAAGRSMTSPAAIWFATRSGRMRTLAIGALARRSPPRRQPRGGPSAGGGSGRGGGALGVGRGHLVGLRRGRSDRERRRDAVVLAESGGRGEVERALRRSPGRLGVGDVVLDDGGGDQELATHAAQGSRKPWSTPPRSAPRMCAISRGGRRSL